MKTDTITFQKQCLLRGVAVPYAEHYFAKKIKRKWRFDYAWPDLKVALEVEGGVWTGGRHNRPSGFLKDIEKYNEAALMGWKVLRCTPKEIDDGSVFELLRRAL